MANPRTNKGVISDLKTVKHALNDAMTEMESRIENHHPISQTSWFEGVRLASEVKQLVLRMEDLVARVPISTPEERPALFGSR